MSASPELAHAASVKVLTELLGRLEVATGPDRELDATIALACGATVDSPARNSFGVIIAPAWWTMPGESRETWPHRTTPWPLTASLDAALALVERVLPSGIALNIGSSKTARIWPLKPAEGSFEGIGRTPALALLTALLRAMCAEAKP